MSTELGTAGRRPRNSATKATTADAQELTLKRGESPAPRGSLPARDSLPGQAQSHRTPCPSSPRAADPGKSLRDSGSGWCSSALLSRALWPAAYPASGFSPRACCLPRTHCPRELRRLAWNNVTVQKRRPNTLGSQDQFSGCPTDYFRSLVPTPPLAPSPESPATSPRRCTLASGGELR